jgi:hypothetical protein
MTDTISGASFLADFYAVSAYMDYMEYAGMCITLLLAYFSDADVDNTHKSAKNKAILSECVIYS